MTSKKPEGVDDGWRMVYNCRNLEEVQAVLRPGHLFRVNVSHNAQIVGDPDHYIPDRFRASVAVTKKEAMRLVADLLDSDPMTTRDDKPITLLVYTTERTETYRRNRQTGELYPPRLRRVCWIG